MRVALSALVCFGLTFAPTCTLAKTSSWTLGSYPDLPAAAKASSVDSATSSACGSHVGSGGRLCDPDTLLTAEEAAATQRVLVDIEEEILHNCEADGGRGSTSGGHAQRGYQVAFAIARRMRLGADSKEAAAQRFAKGLHDRWGVGHAACNDGIVLFLSKDDRQVGAVLVCGCAASCWAQQAYASAPVIQRCRHAG